MLARLGRFISSPIVISSVLGSVVGSATTIIFRRFVTSPVDKSALLSDVFSNLFNKYSRVVIPTIREDLGRLVEVLAPHKLSITTLEDVFRAFNSAWVPNSLHVLFEFDSRIWKGTVKTVQVSFNSSLVTFTNIKLPNDSFFYTPKYKEATSFHDIVLTDDTKQFVVAVAKALMDRNLFKRGELERVELKYFLEAERFAIYFWIGKKMDRCITIKFENGFHEGVTKQNPAKYIEVLQQIQTEENNK